MKKKFKDLPGQLRISRILRVFQNLYEPYIQSNAKKMTWISQAKIIDNLQLSRAYGRKREMTDEKSGLFSEQIVPLVTA